MRTWMDLKTLRAHALGRYTRGGLPQIFLVRPPRRGAASRPLAREISVATYNVHRWTGHNGRGRPDPARACFVISELQADVIALQEVLRPFAGEDPLEALADRLGLHVAFAATRTHRLGELGNAILSRWPIGGVFVLDLSYSRIERRLAMAAQLPYAGGVLDIVATHLALGDRTRHRQVRSLLDHPRLQGAPTLLLGDLNAWRRCKATRARDSSPSTVTPWPPSFGPRGPCGPSTASTAEASESWASAPTRAPPRGAPPITFPWWRASSFRSRSPAAERAEPFPLRGAAARCTRVGVRSAVAVLLAGVDPGCAAVEGARSTTDAGARARRPSRAMPISRFTARVPHDAELHNRPA
jgi:endonuclease/exonuclease/phosphatase family metal-dependent hydrolase